jgi:hypothetical protein
VAVGFRARCDELLGKRTLRRHPLACARFDFERECFRRESAAGKPLAIGLDCPQSSAVISSADQCERGVVIAISSAMLPAAWSFAPRFLADVDGACSVPAAGPPP